MKQITIKFNNSISINELINDDYIYGIYLENFKFIPYVKDDYITFSLLDKINEFRGIEIHFENDNIINLLLSYPSPKDEIYFFYDFIAKICQRWNIDYVFVDAKKTHISKLNDEIANDLKISENEFKHILNDDSNSIHIIFSILFPIFVDKTERKKLREKLKLNNFDYLKIYSDYIISKTSYNVDYKVPILRKNGLNKIEGIYEIYENVPTVLTKKPFLFRKDIEVNNWKVIILKIIPEKSEEFNNLKKDINYFLIDNKRKMFEIKEELSFEEFCNKFQPIQSFDSNNNIYIIK